MLIFLGLTISILLIVVEMENAPTYKDGKFVYKEWFTIFGIKIKRNK
jgi:hypothetical protein